MDAAFGVIIVPGSFPVIFDTQQTATTFASAQAVCASFQGKLLGEEATRQNSAGIQAYGARFWVSAVRESATTFVFDQGLPTEVEITSADNLWGFFQPNGMGQNCTEMQSGGNPGLHDELCDDSTVVRAVVCEPLTKPALPSDGPSFRQVVDDWFDGNTASVEAQYGLIEFWDTSQVTDMSDAFRDRSTFNSNIGAWNTSSVTSMAYMFSGADAFNQDIGAWKTSSVADMSYMFADADLFNKDIRSWDTSRVADMTAMFGGAKAFDQYIGGWNTSSVVEMKFMFSYASAFDQDIGGWDTAKVIDMRSMFELATSFNQDISGWNVRTVADFRDVFDGASSFDQDLCTWGYQNTLSGFQIGQAGRFGSCTFPPDPEVFRQATSQWALDAVVDIPSYGADGNGADIVEAVYGPIEDWNISAVTDMSHAFLDLPDFNSDLIQDWDTSGVRNMSEMFAGASSFNQDISNWDTSQVVDMSGMFCDASGFNQPIGNWDTSAVTSMSGMFNGAAAFNQALTTWDTSRVTNMRAMFMRASSFNQPILMWDVDDVLDLSEMFSGASAFNQDLSSWDTRKVKAMSGMFDSANAFDQDISSWDTSAVTDMSFMFSSAGQFNQPIGTWNTRSATTMRGMFSGAVAFNQDITNWDTRSVKDMSLMFQGPSSFNQDISSWNVTNVESFAGMFSGNSVFEQDLCSWNFNPSAANDITSAAEPCAGPETLPVSIIAGAAGGGALALLALAAALYGIRRRTKDENKLIGQLLRRQNFTGFISHYKGEAGPSARILKGLMTDKLSGGGVPFLDSDNLSDLGKLLEQLRSSKTLIVILSTNYLRRPFCLAELAEACRSDMDIISVRLVGVHAFDFQEIAIVTESHVQQLLSDDEWNLLEEEGISIGDVVAGIKRIKQIIALPFSPNGSAKIQSVEVDEIIAQMHEKTKDHPVAIAVEDKI